MRKSESGLTLLEVLVALVILAVGITGALRAFSMGLVTCKAAESYSLAALLAQQVASEIERTADLSSGPLTGDFGKDAPGYTWEADVQQATGTDLRRVRVTVLWDVGKRHRHLQLFTLLRPVEEEAPAPAPTSTEESR